jgi:hypothetical protein
LQVGLRERERAGRRGAGGVGGVEGRGVVFKVARTGRGRGWARSEASSHAQRAKVGQVEGAGDEGKMGAEGPVKLQLPKLEQRLAYLKVMSWKSNLEQGQSRDV